MTEVRYLDGPMAGIIQERHLPDDKQVRVPYECEGFVGALVYHRQECGGYSMLRPGEAPDD